LVANKRNKCKIDESEIISAEGVI